MILDHLELVPVTTGNMGVIWDAPIEMDDGITLRADVFLPEKVVKFSSGRRIQFDRRLPVPTSVYIL